MKKLLQVVWPRPERFPADLHAETLKNDDALDQSILGLKDLGGSDASLYLEAARHITAYEDKRKAGAETRATTFIAAVAALIPLMTWAIGSTAPSVTCSSGWGCYLWTGVFTLAVLYFITAAYWALKTLAVASYHVIGVEDIVQFKEKRLNLQKVLIQQTLLQGRRNRDTINTKLTFIKVAQRRFFNGLAVLGFLLMLDPAARFGVLEAAQTHLTVWASSLRKVIGAPSKNLEMGDDDWPEAEGSVLMLRMDRQLPPNASQRP